MWRWVLPILFTIFGLISVMILKSVAPSLVDQQFLFFLIGSAIFLGVAKQSFAKLEHFSIMLYMILIALLTVTLLVGSVTRGSTRWISIGDFFNIQGSQLAVPFVGLFGAHFLTRHAIKKWRNLLILLGIIGLPGGLIFIEPDLGTTLVYMCSVLVMLYFHPPTKQQLVILGLATAFIAVIGWDVLLQPYQKERLLSFVSFHQGQEEAGYNAQQALIAVGSGRVWGRGLGQGIQSHLRFLPERQTDFVFASLAEELGFVGSLVILGLYSLLIGSLLHIAHQTQSESGRLYCYTIATMTAIQAGINIGMNIGLLPITGVTLPLLSYGGSSILSLAGSYGIAQSLIHHHTLHRPKVFGTVSTD